MTETIVALDLGTTHLRGIEAQIKKGALPKILKTHSVPLKTGVMASGVIESPEMLTAAIKKLWAEGKFSAKKVVGMATGGAYDNRVLPNVPWSPPADFKKLLPYYLKERLPYDIEDYYFDSHTLNEYYQTESNDPQKYKKILVTAVTRKFTDTFIDAVEKAGYIPVGIDVMPLALIRASLVQTDTPAAAVTVSIDLGGDITTIVVHQNAQPLYINTATPLGGVRITEEISKSLGLSMTEAEMVKISFSLPPEEQAELTASTYYEGGETHSKSLADIPEGLKADAYNIIAREVSSLISHISDILEDAFMNRAENPFEIVLTGRGSELVTLTGRIQAELGIPVKVLQPFDLGPKSKLPKELIKNPNGFSALYGLLVGQDDE